MGTELHGDREGGIWQKGGWGHGGPEGARSLAGWYLRDSFIKVGGCSSMRLKRNRLETNRPPRSGCGAATLS